MSRRASSRRSPPGEKVEPDFEHFEKSVGAGREALDESIRHDYSTSDKGIVPLDRRRPLWHFVGIWTGALYIAGVAVVRVVAPDSRAALGFASPVPEDGETTAALDIAASGRE